MPEARSSADQRLSRLEAVVEGLAGDLSSLAATVQQYVSSQGRTNWPTLIAAGSLFLTIASMGGALVYFVVKGEAQTVQASMGGRIEGLSMLLTRHEEALLALDNVLQREMRILDDVQATRIEKLDEMLQREFGITIAPISKAVDDNGSALREILLNKFDQDDHQNFRATEFEPLEQVVNQMRASRWTNADGMESRRLIADQGARLLALERVIEGLESQSQTAKVYGPRE